MVAGVGSSWQVLDEGEEEKKAEIHARISELQVLFAECADSTLALSPKGETCDSTKGFADR